MIDSEEKSTQDKAFDGVFGSQKDPSKPLLLYWNKKNYKMFGTRNDLMLLIFPIMILLVVVVPYYLVYFTISESIAESFLGGVYTLGALLGIVVIVRIIMVKFAERDNITKTRIPVIEIYPHGLSIHCPYRNYDLIPWHAIKEVRVESWLFWRFLQIIPNDPEYLLQFESEDRFEISRNYPSELSVVTEKRELYKFMGFLIPPLRNISMNISDEYLPLDASQIAECINIRKEKYSSTTDDTGRVRE